MSKAVAIVSGGMDSVTLAYLLKSEGHDLHLLTFDYGQRHRKELVFAECCAKALDADFDIVDLSGLTPLLKGSALTDTNIEIPEGHYAASNMAVTVVPNRNAIMLTVAYAVAVANEADIVAAGFHSGDHPIYPDCRPAFVRSFDSMQYIATEGYAKPHLHLYSPFINQNKADIVRVGAHLNVPYANTWSCYKGDAYHCGKCGTCVERQAAFMLAGIEDPTVYEKGAS